MVIFYGRKHSVEVTMMGVFQFRRPQMADISYQVGQSPMVQGEVMSI